MPGHTVTCVVRIACPPLQYPSHCPPLPEPRLTGRLFECSMLRLRLCTCCSHGLEGCSLKYICSAFRAQLSRFFQRPSSGPVASSHSTTNLDLRRFSYNFRFMYGLLGLFDLCSPSQLDNKLLEDREVCLPLCLSPAPRTASST